MAENNVSEIVGKKIFFVYPHSVIHEELINEIVSQEYEVYTLTKHTLIKQIAAKYPNSIFYINIDSTLRETEWEEYVQQLMNDKEIEINIGILSYNVQAKDVIERYLLEIGITCGYIKLKLGVEETQKIILKLLDVNEAKGRRKYVRYQNEAGEELKITIQTLHGFINGEISDISSVGFSVIFEEFKEFKKGALLEDIEIYLKGRRIKIDGVVIGSRKVGGTLCYIIVFKADDYHKDKVEKIKDFIHTSLQRRFINEFKIF